MLSLSHIVQRLSRHQASIMNSRRRASFMLSRTIANQIATKINTQKKLLSLFPTTVATHHYDTTPSLVNTLQNEYPQTRERGA